MKKLLAVLMAFVLAASLCVPAFGAGKADARLRFDKNGNFKILVLADVQDGYPMSEAVLAFIAESLDFAEPDLVVFAGDNVTNGDARGFDQMLQPLVDRGVPFTFVLGNHDEGVGLDRDGILREYQRIDGCLAYDADPALHGAATHNLPILSSDGSKVAYNLYLFDSGANFTDSEGKWLGYDWVRKDQINWYDSVREELKAENGGELVPAMAFQHIIPKEVAEHVFIESPVALGDLTVNFQDGTSLTRIPDFSTFDGYIFETSCPGYGSDGQWQALVDGGDVVAMVVGHDHTNNFIANVDGVDLIQTPGVSYVSYHNNLYQGARVIEISEDDPWTYRTYCLTANELAAEDGSHLADSGERSNFSYRLSAFFFKVFEFFRKYLIGQLAA